jgi:hypothetical protein
MSWCTVKAQGQLYLYLYFKSRKFENMVLMRIFCCNRNDVTGDWRKLHNDEPYDVYSSNAIRVSTPRMMRMSGHVARIEVVRNAYKNLA